MIKDSPEIKLNEETIGPFKSGQEIELAYWMAEELVNSGLAKFRDQDLLDITKLTKIHWKETIPTSRQIPRLQKNFYFILKRLLKEMSEENDVVSYHLFTLETKDEATAHCRDLAPLYGIDEEAATGTANGALSCYLWKYGKIGARQTRSLVFEQGYSMNRPSEIMAKLEVEGEIVTRVVVGGVASNIQRAEITI